MTLAPWQTERRLLLATLLPVSLYALLRHLRAGRVPEAFLGLVALYLLVAWTHVVTTSRTAAWILDSHMVPWSPMPSATATLGLAWGATLGWFGVLAVAAGLLQRAGAGARVLLLAAAVAPLLAAGAFPTDPYAAVVEPNTFVDPTYTASALLGLGATVLALRSSTTHPGRRQPDDTQAATARSTTG